MIVFAYTAKTRVYPGSRFGACYYARPFFHTYFLKLPALHFTIKLVTILFNFVTFIYLNR